MALETEIEASLPNLLCGEAESSRDGILEFDSKPDREFVETLLLKEADFRNDGFGTGERAWLKRARSFAIKWILENRALFRYQNRTAYLSVIYLDQFLMRRNFTITDGKLWQIQLLSIACLSLAAKMEEPEAKAFSEYRVNVSHFEGFTVQKMELMVLNAFGWKMSYPTPFAYLNYFAAKFFDQSMHKELLDRASELVLGMMEDVNAGKHRPSIIAAAALLACYDNQLTKAAIENKVEAIPSWGSIEKDFTFSCYTIYKENLVLETPKSVISYNSPPSTITDDSTTTSKGASKRRLDFDDSDGNRGCPMKNSKT